MKCAIVVTFRPDADVVENLRILVSELDFLVIVDNGSSAEALAFISSAVEGYDCAIVEMNRNAGLGAALNAGLMVLRGKPASATLLFDQDSRIEPDFVDSMYKSLDSSDAQVGMLIPRYKDRSTGEFIPPLRFGDGPIEAAMTSGMLLRFAMLDVAGLFDEKLFIDCTDYEYCLRIRKAGYVIAQSSSLLYHSPAKRAIVSFRGKTLCTVSNNPPKRRYYVARNSTVLFALARGQFPDFRRALARAYVAELAKIILFERRKTTSLWMICRGLFDAKRKKFGYVVPL